MTEGNLICKPLILLVSSLSSYKLKLSTHTTCVHLSLAFLHYKWPSLSSYLLFIRIYPFYIPRNILPLTIISSITNIQHWWLITLTPPIMVMIGKFLSLLKYYHYSLTFTWLIISLHFGIRITTDHNGITD